MQDDVTKEGTTWAPPLSSFFHEGPDWVFTLQTKWIWSHNNNASSEEDYVPLREKLTLVTSIDYL
jgi:hypothetical protein